VIDAAKGIEPRTRKLFEVCRLRDIPIITFISKMDRESRDPCELLDEIEKTLALDTAPITWPIGRGRNFMGTIDVGTGGVRLLDGDAGVAGRLREMTIAEVAALNPRLDAEAVSHELDLVRHACKRFDPQTFLGPYDADVLRQLAEEFWRRRSSQRACRGGAAGRRLALLRTAGLAST